MRHRNGAPIKCQSNEHAVFRVVDNQRRWYPNPAIAASWDPKWMKFVRINCDGLKEGEKLAMKEISTPSPTPSPMISPVTATSSVYNLRKRS